MIATPNPIKWWDQFPPTLRLVTRARLIASIGAGGVIYLTPLIFNKINFSATQIGSGIAAAALVGTIARLLSGAILDKGIKFSWPLRVTAVFAIIADILLFHANDFSTYLKGQLFIGMAAGLYWPSIELAVPSSCGSFPSSKGFALVRSADAFGVSIGAIFGALSALLGIIRIVYIIDSVCMCLLLLTLRKDSLTLKRYEVIDEKTNKNLLESIHLSIRNKFWIEKLIPLLVISLIATLVLSLLQSALPIDLVKGSLLRPAINEFWSSSLIAIHLGLLVVIQWPIGRWLSGKNVKFGLNISLISFGVGCLLLAISSFSSKGIVLVFLAQIPLAIALAAFLPTATEAIFQNTPNKKRGIAMALFSQCFAISAFSAPLIAGRVIDSKGQGLIIWVFMSVICFSANLLLRKANLSNNKS